MNSLTDWNPIRELEAFQNRILRAFRPDAQNGHGDGNGDGRKPLMESQWSPSVNITENESEYVITADLPEVKLPDVKVTVENGVLTLKGERKIEKEQKETRYHLVERSYGTFERRFSLPGDADPKMVNAAFKDGVLRISIGRSEAARPRQIEVRVG